MESALLQCRHMLQQARAMGQTPLVYIMNPATNRHLTDLAAIEVKPKQSTFQRWYMGVRKKKLILQVLFGVPILQNQHLNDGFVSLQLVPVPMQPQPAAPASPMPFVKREPVIQEAPADAVPTIQDLAQGGAQGPSVTDVLIKAIEGAEAVQHVAVLRIYRNGDVDASSTMSHLELSGAIQKFQLWVLQHGGQ